MWQWINMNVIKFHRPILICVLSCVDQICASWFSCYFLHLHAMLFLLNVPDPRLNIGKVGFEPIPLRELEERGNLPCAMKPMRGLNTESYWKLFPYCLSHFLCVRFPTLPPCGNNVGLDGHFKQGSFQVLGGPRQRVPRATPFSAHSQALLTPSFPPTHSHASPVPICPPPACLRGLPLPMLTAACTDHNP